MKSSTSSLLTELAAKGAEVRAAELRRELAALEAHFPTLRDGVRVTRTNGTTRAAAPTPPAPAAPRRKLSAAARKRIGDAARRRWAKWRSDQS